MSSARMMTRFGSRSAAGSDGTNAARTNSAKAVRYIVNPRGADFQPAIHQGRQDACPTGSLPPGRAERNEEKLLAAAPSVGKNAAVAFHHVRPHEEFSPCASASRCCFSAS